MEDHAFRACVAALGIQEESAKLAVDLKVGDGIDLSLRIGLNSGQVIAGELGSGPSAYTAIGAQVEWRSGWNRQRHQAGSCQESTARLVDGAVVLAETELLHIKGADAPVPARRLLGVVWNVGTSTDRNRRLCSGAHGRWNYDLRHSRRGDRRGRVRGLRRLGHRASARAASSVNPQRWPPGAVSR